ncbi:MAG TPA: polysaccharide lyase family 1 protein, partial [Polyangia bacterium]
GGRGSSPGGSAGGGGRGSDGGVAGAAGRGSGGGASGATGLGGATGSGGAPTGTGGATAATAGPPETKPLGYGRNTTGGGSASPVTADSFAALQAAIDGHSGAGGLVVTYTGKFNFASIPDPCAQFTKEAQIVEIKQKSNITIQGADGSSANFGLHIASSSSNIIVRNMTLGLLPGGDAADAISVEGMSSGFPTDIWIDHNELFSSLADCAGAGDSSFDGLLDFKKGADRVTVSYNYLHDHHKVSLNGFSDSDDAVRHITFHHNVFENVGARTPLQRNGFSHMLNNVFHEVSTSGINVRMGGYSLVEANYFDTVKNAVTSRDSSALGFWELRNNNVKSPADFAAYGLTWSPSSDQPTKDATDWATTAAFPEPLGYSYTADPAGCLKDNLLAYAGAGKKLATLKCP